MISRDRWKISIQGLRQAGGSGDLLHPILFAGVVALSRQDQRFAELTAIVGDLWKVVDQPFQNRSRRLADLGGVDMLVANLRNRVIVQIGTGKREPELRFHWVLFRQALQKHDRVSMLMGALLTEPQSPENQAKITVRLCKFKHAIDR